MQMFKLISADFKMSGFHCTHPAIRVHSQLRRNVIRWELGRVCIMDVKGRLKTLKAPVMLSYL